MSDDKTEMVVGFVFDSAGRVVLTERSGLLSGITTVIEKSEDPFSAMVRGAFEQVGADIDKWGCFLQLELVPTRVYYFRAVEPAATLNAARSLSEYPVTVLPPSAALTRYQHAPNLAWILPLAAYHREGESVYETIVAEAVTLP